MDSKEVRLGQYREIIQWQQRWLTYPSYEPLPNATTEIMESAPVCCLADIPIQHLDYQDERYGRFAIGFHRQAVVRNSNFNPVLYALESARIPRSVASALKNLNSARSYVKAINNTIDRFSTVSGKYTEDHLNDPVQDAKFYLDRMLKEKNAAIEEVKYLLAHVKTFSENDFDTIYCEREWRSLKPFHFKYDDVAMIVLPKRGNINYFKQFIDTKVESLLLPRQIPIVPWEDLVEL